MPLSITSNYNPLIVLLLLTLSGCGGGSGNVNNNNNNSPPANNQVPTANAGNDQIIATGSNVTLNGNQSLDPDGQTLFFRWQLITAPVGSSATLNDIITVNSSFTADLDGDYVVELIVNDGITDSSADSITITSTTANIVPTANAGVDQTVTTTQQVQLDGSLSDDANNDPLNFSWSFTSRPSSSSATLSSTSVENPTFVPDLDGSYALSLIVDDNRLDSPADSVTITATSTGTITDDFAGSGSLIGYTTNNPSVLLDVTRTSGRYRADLFNNSGDKTLHFHNQQGRLDAKLVTFPFTYIARNIGIGSQADSQVPPAGSGSRYTFAGIQVHVTDLNSRNSSHVVVGHRGSGAPYTVEGKNTVNGVSEVDDAGANIAPDGRADIRIVGNADRTLTVSWQLPNLTGNANNDNWILYRGTGNLRGTSPAYGSNVYIGLITYAQGSAGIPFVGTCDAIEFNP